MDDQQTQTQPDSAPVTPIEPQELPKPVTPDVQSEPAVTTLTPTPTSFEPSRMASVAPETPHQIPPVYQPPVVTPKVTSTPKVILPAQPGESASEFQHRVIQSEQVKEVKQARRSYKLENAVGVLMGSIEASLAIRLAFKLLGAKPTNGFVNFLYQFTGVFANPFEGIFGANPMFGSFELDIGAIIGMIIYATVGFGALKLVKLF